LIYSLSHYAENPVVIIIVAALFLLFIINIGDDQIIVYQDRVTQTKNSISSFLFKSKNKTCKIEDIKSAYLQPISNSSPTEIGIALLLAFILPKRVNQHQTQPIYFDLKSGKTVQMDTYLENRKMGKIITMVNSLAKKEASPHLANSQS
jgi:hypothetical protein